MSSIISRSLSILSQCLLYHIPICIDRIFRYMDHFLNNTYHPKRERWSISGHGPSILLVMAYTVCVSLYGPTWDAVMAYFPEWYDTEVIEFTWKNIAMFVFLQTLLLAIVLFPRFNHKGEYVRSLHIILLSLITLFIIAFADEGATEADNTIYYHGFFVFGLILLLYAWLAKPFAALLLRTFIKENGEQIKNALKNTELFKKPKPPSLLHSKVVFALISAVTHYPFHLLLLPSLLILVLKDVGSSTSYTLIVFALILSCMLSVWGSLHSRWDNMIQLITRVFMRGGMRIVSIMIILLAIARLLDVGYVTTVMDGTPLTLIPYFLAFYFYFLAYEYWANRSFNEILLPIFGSRYSYGRVKFDMETSANGKDFAVESSNRYLQFHGIDRFLVAGTMRENKSVTKAYDQYQYETYNRETLFRRLLESDIGQHSDEDKRVRARAILRRLRRLTHIYFSTLNILLVLAVLSFFALANFNKDQKPVWTSNINQLDKVTFSLSDSFHQKKINNQPAILIAASGGGTRAALYASSVLYGLHKSNHDQNIVMASGVSGGGASLAYFALHRDDLIKKGAIQYDQVTDNCSNRYAHNHYSFDKNKQDQKWKCYFEKISRPFIKDVIQGSSEWRIAGDVSNGTLLAESLARNFLGGGPLSSKNRKNVTFGDLNGFGILLNTALVAHPYEYSEELKSLYAGRKVKVNNFYTVHGGSRLVFTNLTETSGFPTAGSLKKITKEIDTEDVFLKYEIIQDSRMPLTVAAALNANFPPVFSNSLVVKKENVGEKIKETAYYVTDGGAVENRGILSLIYALKSGLEEYQKKYNGECLPDIHVVVAEASASSIDYNNNRGLETALGGSLPIANQLYQELLKDVRKQYDDINSACVDSVSSAVTELKLHYLSMPRFFRTRGGMGTHWMMPSSVKLANPNQPDPLLAKEQSYRLNRSELEALLAILYAAPEQCENIVSNKTNSDKVAICEWLRQSKSQQVWNKLKQQLMQ